MAFYLMIGSKGSVQPLKDAQYFQSLEAAKANVGIADCAFILESDNGLNPQSYDARNRYFYTRECGWFEDKAIPSDDNPFFCGQYWQLGD